MKITYITCVDKSAKAKLTRFIKTQLFANNTVISADISLRWQPIESGNIGKGNDLIAKVYYHTVTDKDEYLFCVQKNNKWSVL